MQSGTKNLLLSVFACLAIIFLMSGCSKTLTPPPCNLSCGPHSIAFTADGTAYLLGYSQLLKIDPTGNIILNNPSGTSLDGSSDMFGISMSGNIWTITASFTNGNAEIINDALLILNSQGNFITQFTTNFDPLTSVAISTSADIGWGGGWSWTNNSTTLLLEALNISGQSLTSFTLPPVSISSYNRNYAVKLTISPLDGTVWAWTPGYLSGYLFTGLVHGPYPINLYEFSGDIYPSCSTNEKWMAVNPVTNDIWMGNSATTTVVALSPDGNVQFQKNLNIYVSTMAVSPKTGNVWIGSNNKIEVLDPYGNVIKQLTLKNLNCITYIAISPLNDSVWVGNSINISSTDKNIFILDDNGNIITSIHMPVACALPCPS